MDKRLTFDEAIAGAERWNYASATANYRQGINVYRNCKRYWYVRCELSGEPLYELKDVEIQ